MRTIGLQSACDMKDLGVYDPKTEIWAKGGRTIGPARTATADQRRRRAYLADPRQLQFYKQEDAMWLIRDYFGVSVDVDKDNGWKVSRGGIVLETATVAGVTRYYAMEAALTAALTWIMKDEQRKRNNERYDKHKRGRVGT